MITADHPVIQEVFSNPHLVKAERCRRSLFYFIQEFWDEIIREAPVYNWHISYLCEELEEVAYRVIAQLPKAYDLIINIPPGTTKSTVVAQMFPVWVWIAKLPTDYLGLKGTIPIKRTGEHCRFITGSYSSPLALEHAEYSRDIIRSDKFKLYFPDVEIRYDKDMKSNYKNTKGGTRFSTSVGATVTGVHGHFIIIDDPVNPGQALSDTERISANKWMDTTLSTRKVNKEITPTILIMQRLHQDDPTGHLLAKKDKKIRHICLPGDTEYDIKPKKLKRKYKNGLLDPSRLNRKVLLEMHTDLGSYGYAGQVGQDPRPREGGMFQREWFEIVDVAPAGGTISVRGWDFAGTSDFEAKKQRSNPAYTAGVKMKHVNGVFYIEHITRFRGSPGAVRRSLLNTASQDGEDVLVDGPQDPGQAGKAQAQDFASHLAGYNVRFSPESGDKVLRAEPLSAQAEAGNVKLVRGIWNEDFLDEGAFFPNGFKDQIDAAARAFRRLLKIIKQEQVMVGGPGNVANTHQLIPEKDDA
jgi:predicted phage terminase large subunit-like protein